MFEVGKRYEFRILEGGDEITMWRVIEKYEHPLIKFSDHGSMRGEVINVTSPNFISAVLQND